MIAGLSGCRSDASDGRSQRERPGAVEQVAAVQQTGDPEGLGQPSWSAREIAVAGGRAGAGPAGEAAALARRRRATSIPEVTSPARSSTAAADPVGPHTTLTHQCMPKTKYT